METQLVYTTPANFLSYMITNPGKWKTYFTQCAFSKSAFEQEVPWISSEAIDKISEFIKPGMSVLEFGGGGSTLFFANKGLEVTTIESSIAWKSNLESKLVEHDLENFAVYYRPFEAEDESSLRNSRYMNALPDMLYDVILVDGPEIGGYKARPLCFEWAEQHIKEGGIIIVDDSWRYTQLLEENSAVYVKEYPGIGPGRKGMTKTDIYYY